MNILATDFYTEARFSMERLAELYNKLYGLKIICLRNFSIYGPHEKFKENYANMVSQFLWNIMKNERPTIYGDGNQTRDCVYVDDAVNAALKASTYNKKSFDVFNVGTGEATTFNQIFALLKEKTHSTLEPIYVKNEIKNYVYNTRADITKAQKELGFVAQVDLKSGVDKLLTYYNL